MSLRRLWTIPRATAVGLLTGLAAVILWPLHASYPEQLFWTFVALLAVTAFCGLSILSITAVDLILHRRGKSLRPVRAFDIFVGLMLAVPSLVQLDVLLPRYAISS